MIIGLLQPNEKFLVNIDYWCFFAFFGDFFAENCGKAERARKCFLRKTTEGRKNSETLLIYFRYSASVSAMIISHRQVES